MDWITDMPTLTQIRARCDDFLTSRWAALVAAQEAYFQTHGRYWQGLATHDLPPDHTTAAALDTVADRLATHPTDQSETWLDFLPALQGVSIPAALAIDVYEATQGHGFVATLYVRFNGTAHSRTQAIGPLASDYNRPWAAVGTDA